MDGVSVLDSAYAGSIISTTTAGSGVRPQDSVSMISGKGGGSAGGSLLSRRLKLDEPTIPATVRLSSRQSRSATASVISSHARSQSYHRGGTAQSARIRSISRSIVSQRSSRSRPETATTTRSLSVLDSVKSVEKELHKKLVGGSVVSLRALFKTNSTEILTTATGVLSPVVMLPGLQKALCSFLNTNYITESQVKLLLKRLLIDHKKPIHFETFYGRVRDGVPVSDYPSWLDPAKRRKAQSQDHESALDAFSKVTHEDMRKVLPSLDGDSVTKSDLRRALEYLGFYLDDVNFQKIWEKVTSAKMSRGSVMPAATLRIYLGYETAPSKPGTAASQSEASTVMPDDDLSDVGSKMDKREYRKVTIAIEKWLKDRFRKTFEAMRSTFEEGDKGLHHGQLTGSLPRATFRACLSTYGLQLSNDEQLEMFLARCGLSPLARERVDYRKFLQNFQDRSEFGNCRKILGDPNHRFNQALTESIGPRTTVSAVEARLLALFQGEYLSLIGTFHRLDRTHKGTLEPEEFRAAIESTLHTDFSDEEFEQFYYNACPLDKAGNVKYTKFMALFDAAGKSTPSMFPADAKSLVNFDEQSLTTTISQTRSTIEQTTEQLLRKALLKHRDVLRQEYERIDALNTGRLSLDTLHAVLQAAGIRPMPSRSALRALWKSKDPNMFFKKADGTVSFYELERWAELADGGKMGRHVLPRIPVLGDDDKNKASKTLSNTQNILESQLVAAVENKIDWVRHQLRQMDSFRTGYISRDEFVTMCTELVPCLYEQDAARISRKLDQHDDGRVGYVRWIKSILRRTRSKGRHTDNTTTRYKFKENDEVVLKPMHKQRLAKRTASKMGINNLSVLKESLLKCDLDAAGHVKPVQFKAALRGTGAALQDRDLRKLVAAYSRVSDRMIDYRSFLRDAFSMLA